MRQVRTPSYQYENLNEIDELLKCTICLNPLEEPVMHIHCGNTFCHVCIEGKTVCPLCNENIKESSSNSICKAPRSIILQLDNLKIICPQCNTSIKRGYYKQHSNESCQNLRKENNNTLLHENEQLFNDKLEKIKNELQNKYDTLFNELKREKEEFEKNIIIDNNNKKSQKNEGDVVKFNIGGKPFYFLKETICTKIKNPNYGIDDEINNEYYESTLLETLISGDFPVTMVDKDFIFIDRDPKLFHYIANYLRNFGSIEKYIVELPKDKGHLMRLKNEANYFGIQGLIDLIERNYSFLTDSNIINNNNKRKYQKLLNKWIDEDKYQPWELIYQGSRDGFKAQDFHKLCDGKPHTITIIKSTSGYIFGGYTTSAWNEYNSRNLNGYCSSPNSFLFSLYNPTKQDSKPMRFELNSKKKDYAICCHSSYGPRFGGADLCIKDNCNIGDSYSNLGDTYGTNVSFIDLTGTKYFTVEEIEVFTKIKLFHNNNKLN
ncbi:hypothetical protein ABK040_001416 [Willaertia magna]